MKPSLSALPNQAWLRNGFLVWLFTVPPFVRFMSGILG